MSARAELLRTAENVEQSCQAAVQGPEGFVEAAPAEEQPLGLGLAPTVTGAVNITGLSLATLRKEPAHGAQTVNTAKDSQTVDSAKGLAGASTSKPKVRAKPQLDLKPIHGTKQAAEPAQGRLPFQPGNRQAFDRLGEKGDSLKSSQSLGMRDFEVAGSDQENKGLMRYFEVAGSNKEKEPLLSESAKVAQHAPLGKFIDLSNL
jgi:hypothetical protein